MRRMEAPKEHVLGDTPPEAVWKLIRMTRIPRSRSSITKTR
jgi:hypothetical protein